MGAGWKTTRYALLIAGLIGAGLWTSVTFLGENWQDQFRHLGAMAGLLLLILLCAALLVGLLKLASHCWQRVTGAETPPAVDDQSAAADKSSE